MHVEEGSTLRQNGEFFENEELIETDLSNMKQFSQAEFYGCNQGQNTLTTQEQIFQRTYPRDTSENLN